MRKMPTMTSMMTPLTTLAREHEQGSQSVKARPIYLQPLTVRATTLLINIVIVVNRKMSRGSCKGVGASTNTA
jgi:hypothetical protein